jgi:hypothetical protein
MAHFAQLDENNNVINVIVINNEALLNEYNNEIEQKGIDLCGELFGGRWLQTSYNTKGGVHTFGGNPLRKNYAGKNCFYDPIRDAFIQHQPYPSWTLNEQTCLWEAPNPMPQEGFWTWDEPTLSWISIA